MKFTLNGLEVTCTPAEFNELRGLGTITAERPSVSTQSVADACKAADKELYYVDGPGFHWDTNKNRLCLRGKKELKDTLFDSPDVDDALAKDYKPIKDGYVFVYAVADRDKSRVCEYYLKSTLGETYTTEIAYALKYTDPDMAFGFVASHPDKNLCVLRVKVAP